VPLLCKRPQEIFGYSHNVWWTISGDVNTPSHQRQPCILGFFTERRALSKAYETPLAPLRGIPESSNLASLAGYCTESHELPYQGPGGAEGEPY
jgi:hypothetical protein